MPNTLAPLSRPRMRTESPSSKSIRRRCGKRKGWPLPMRYDQRAQIARIAPRRPRVSCRQHLRSPSPRAGGSSISRNSSIPAACLGGDSLSVPSDSSPPALLPASLSMQPPESPTTKMMRAQALEALEQSPSSVYSTKSSFNQPSRAQSQRNRHPDNDGGSPSGEDDLNIFVVRTKHLFELFRLHSETIRPLMSCSPEELLRAGSWWFLTGRLALENAVRDRPSYPHGPAAERDGEATSDTPTWRKDIGSLRKLHLT